MLSSGILVFSSAILATNTSSLCLKDIGSDLARKNQFGGLHFFNPVPMMKLLEVVRFDQTSDETFNTLLEYGKAIGKTTVKCKVCATCSLQLFCIRILLASLLIVFSFLTCLRLFVCSNVATLLPRILISP